MKQVCSLFLAAIFSMAALAQVPKNLKSLSNYIEYILMDSIYEEQRIEISGEVPSDFYRAISVDEVNYVFKKELPYQSPKIAPEWFNKFGNGMYCAMFQRSKNTSWHAFFNIF